MTPAEFVISTGSSPINRAPTKLPLVIILVLVSCMVLLALIACLVVITCVTLLLVKYALTKDIY